MLPESTHQPQHQRQASVLALFQEIPNSWDRLFIRSDAQNLSRHGSIITKNQSGL
jgi:hypothetical protein